MTNSKIQEMYKTLTLLLIRKGLTITTMESATAGLIASLITDTEGSSAVLRGAFVTYSNEAKVLQGVPEQTIARWSVYSEQTAQEMAKACRRTYHADIGIGVTGTMGNVDPENAAASVPGRVYYAISKEEGTVCFTKDLDPQPTRSAYKWKVAGLVGASLLGLLGDNETVA